MFANAKRFTIDDRAELDQIAMLITTFFVLIELGARGASVNRAIIDVPFHLRK